MTAVPLTQQLNGVPGDEVDIVINMFICPLGIERLSGFFITKSASRNEPAKHYKKRRGGGNDGSP